MDFKQFIDSNEEGASQLSDMIHRARYELGNTDCPQACYPEEIARLAWGCAMAHAAKQHFDRLLLAEQNRLALLRASRAPLGTEPQS